MGWEGGVPTVATPTTLKPSADGHIRLYTLDYPGVYTGGYIHRLTHMVIHIGLPGVYTDGYLRRRTQVIIYAGLHR